MKIGDWYRTAQIWSIVYLLNNHKEYSKISSAGPDDGGEYDTYWIRLIKYSEEEVTQAEQDFVSELGILPLGPKEEYRLNLFLDANGDLKGRRMVDHEWQVDNSPEYYITPEMLSTHSLLVRHFYRGLQWKYSGVFWPLIRRVGWNFCAFSLHRIKVWFFNHSFDVTDDYKKVIDALIAANSDQGGAVGAFDICRFLYGPRFQYITPKLSLEAIDHCEQILDFLADSGDIQKIKSGYRHDGHTLHWLKEWRAQEVAEKQQRNQQRANFWLTLILAVSSSVMAYIAYLDLEGRPFGYPWVDTVQTQ